MGFGFSRKLSKSASPQETTCSLSTTPFSSVDATNRPGDGASVPQQTTVQLLDDSVDNLFAGHAAAKAAQDHEKNMSMRYALRHYYVALIWAALMAAPIIMEGYETSLVPNFFSYKNFKEHYGTAVDNKGDDVVKPGWQSGIIISASCGQLFGLWLAPQLVNRLGYRVCTISGLVWAGLCLLLGFFSYSVGPKLHVLLAGELLLGIPWGLFQGLTLPYVSDITPLKLKGLATTMINVFWLIGQLVSAGVLQAASGIKDPAWSVKVPMLIQYSWLVPLALIAFLAPESPLHLIRQGRDAQALKVLRRLNRDPLCNEQSSLDMCRAVNEHEKEATKEMGIQDCFKGFNLRRTEIAVVIYLTQQLVGSPLVFYSVKVLQKAGLSQDSSLYVVIGMYALCMGSTLSSMAAMRIFSRRAMWLGGLTVETICLIIIGALGFFVESGHKPTSWATAALLIVFAAVYNFTIGPVCYTIVAEAPSTRLKAATNSVSRGIYVLFSMANMYLVPNLLEDKPVGWGLGPRAALIWAGTSALCLAWAWFRLPEMKDRSAAQIDVMFEKKLSARAWSKAQL